MTYNDCTVTLVQLAQALGRSTDEVEAVCFMLGISKLWAFTPEQAERITDRIAGIGQDIGGSAL